jgi:uncharacterized membrane protein
MAAALAVSWLQIRMSRVAEANKMTAGDAASACVVREIRIGLVLLVWRSTEPL